MDGPADLEPDTAARDIERVEKDMLDDFEMNLGLVLCLRKARNFRLQERQTVSNRKLYLVHTFADLPKLCNHTDIP